VCVLGGGGGCGVVARLSQKNLFFMEQFALSARPVYVTNGPFITKQELQLELDFMREELRKLSETCEKNHPASVFSGGTTESKWVESAIMGIKAEFATMQQSHLELTYDFEEFKNCFIEQELDSEPAAKEAKTETSETSVASDIPTEISPAQVIDTLEDVF